MISENIYFFHKAQKILKRVEQKMIKFANFRLTSMENITKSARTTEHPTHGVTQLMVNGDTVRNHVKEYQVLE